MEGKHTTSLPVLLRKCERFADEVFADAELEMKAEPIYGFAIHYPIHLFNSLLTQTVSLLTPSSAIVLMTNSTDRLLCDATMT